jgi:hypothetical protein
MKLNNVQIDAIVRTVVEKIEEPYRLHNNQIFESDEYVNFFNTNLDCLRLKEMEVKYEFDEYRVNVALEKMRHHYFKDRLVNVPYINRSTLRDSVILMTIDEVSISDLIDDLVKSYKIDE